MKEKVEKNWRGKMYFFAERNKSGEGEAGKEFRKGFHNCPSSIQHFSMKFSYPLNAC